MVARSRKPAENPEESSKLSEQAEVVEQEVTPVAPSSSKSTEEDQIKAALARATHDGPGDDPAPPSNFEGYATEGVEKQERKSLQVVVQEVLTGNWGDYSVRRQRLQDAGYDPTEIQKLVNMRLMAGAPSSHQPGDAELRDQIKRLEWGTSEDEVKKNLMKAGYTRPTINSLLPHLRGE